MTPRRVFGSLFVAFWLFVLINGLITEPGVTFAILFTLAILIVGSSVIAYLMIAITENTWRWPF